MGHLEAAVACGAVRGALLWSAKPLLCRGFGALTGHVQMSQQERIRTPWKRRWERFRQRALPLVSFLGSVTLLIWLWQEQRPAPSGVGEVEAVRVDVVAQIDGTLAALSRPEWTLYEPVQAGQLLARFDERTAEARLATFHAEVVRLGKTLQAEQARTVVSEADRQQQHRRDAARLAWDFEQYRLTRLERQAIIEADRVELQRRRARVELLTPLHEQGLVSDIAFSDDRLMLAEVATRLEENQAALEEIQQHQSAAAARLADFPPLVAADASAIWAAVQAEIDVQESRIRAIQLEIENLEFRANFGNHRGSALLSGPTCAGRRSNPHHRFGPGALHCQLCARRASCPCPGRHRGPSAGALGPEPTTPQCRRAHRVPVRADSTSSAPESPIAPMGSSSPCAVAPRSEGATRRTGRSHVPHQ